MSKFVLFILSHGRPHCRDTYDMLRRCGYTGKIMVVIDNEDNTADEYKKEFGEENVYIFDKPAIAKRIDSMNNFDDRRSPLFVRNAFWDIAKELHYDYYCEMDDDYYYFGHRRITGAKRTSRLDTVFQYFVEFLLNTPTKTIAFSQGGDHIGGFNDKIILKRKAMNSFFCITDRPFDWKGLMNDDVNTYVYHGIQGDLFFTFNPFQLDQGDTQQNKGGITELYLDAGTYVKSFYTVMLAPSCTKVKQMGRFSMRLHHAIDWKYCTPCIVSEKFRKADN